VLLSFSKHSFLFLEVAKKEGNPGDSGSGREKEGCHKKDTHSGLYKLR